MKVRFFLSHAIQNKRKCIFLVWCENVKIHPYFTQRLNGRHYVSLKSVNHQWFIDFIALHGVI